MKHLIQTVLVSSFLAASSVTYAQSVAQPGDPVIASSANSPGSEGVANAIDGKPTKYLNSTYQQRVVVRGTGLMNQQGHLDILCRWFKYVTAAQFSDYHFLRKV